MPEAEQAPKLKIIASIDEPAVFAKIPAHLKRTAPDQYQSELPLGARAPPLQSRELEELGVIARVVDATGKL